MLHSGRQAAQGGALIGSGVDVAEHAGSRVVQAGGHRMQAAVRVGHAHVLRLNATRIWLARLPESLLAGIKAFRQGYICTNSDDQETYVSSWL